MNRITASIKALVGASVVFVIAMGMLISVPVAQAFNPNILVGQDLSVGETNQNVAMLQGLLAELGYLQIPLNVPLGYYGSLTRDAVARYQARMGVTPAVGYYGQMTKVAMRADFASHGYLNILGW